MPVGTVEVNITSRGVYKHFGPSKLRTLRHWCRGVFWTLRHVYNKLLLTYLLTLLAGLDSLVVTA